MPSSLDLLLFVVLPYIAAAVCLGGTVERLWRHNFSVSSLSSQFFENRLHFWGVMPFHLGILFVLAVHLLLFLAPSLMLRWNLNAARLYALEGVLLAAGLSAFFGYATLGLRRGANARMRIVTTPWDWCVYALLLTQIVLGVLVAVMHAWGSSWFAAVATPYLRSLLRLSPDLTALTALPPIAKAHIVAAYLLIAIFPFSRLVHILVVPNPYLWRPPQVVRWSRRSPASLASR